MRAKAARLEPAKRTFQRPSPTWRALGGQMRFSIDDTFDFRPDTPPGRDPDVLSPRLRAFHQILWSKPLPNDTFFQLHVDTAGVGLHQRPELG
jgi:hypothetical protein